MEICKVKKNKKTFGISALKSNSTVITDRLSRAEILSLNRVLSEVAGYLFLSN